MIQRMSVAVMPTETLALQRGVVTDKTVLAGLAQREHALAEAAGLSWLEHAIHCGDALLALQTQYAGHGFVRWLDDEFEGSRTIAHRYMRVAAFREVIEVERPKNMAHAIRLLGAAGHNRQKGFQESQRDSYAPLRALAKELHESGVSSQVIADELDVAQMTVLNWLDPEGARRRTQAQNERRKRARAARRALERQERERAIKQVVRKQGGAIAEAYAMAERFQDVIAQAHRETEDVDAKRHLSQAESYAYKMRDQIVKALGIA